MFPIHSRRKKGATLWLHHLDEKRKKSKYRNQGKIKITIKTIFISTLCSGGPVSLDFLFDKSWLPFKFLLSKSKFAGFLNFSLCHLVPRFFLRKLESEWLWCWAIEECRLRADKTSSDVLLISDPKTQESHCFNHKRTCSRKTIPFSDWDRSQKK